MKTFEVAHLPLNGISPLKPYLASIGKLFKLNLAGATGLEPAAS